MARPRIAFVVGTRPDTIKSAPVILEFQRYAEVCDPVVIATGQHREMLAQALGAFGITPQVNLDVMMVGQTLADITTRTLERLDAALAEWKPNVVLAQGDTTTTFVAGLASFYRQTPFCHIEAGLRTSSIWNPFPEEFNRRAVALFAAQHYAPTPEAAGHLQNEGVQPGSIFVTGNTGIDAVQIIAEQPSAPWYAEFGGRLLLLTTHRRENWGENQRAIALAAREVVDAFEDTFLVVPMHRNPAIREVLREILGGHPRVDLIEPPEYASFVQLMKRAHLILTDSGGVQEEAPAFGKPVLVLRETTERPEGVTAGVAKLVGADGGTILAEASRLLQDDLAYAAMAQARSPYGDGRAAARIRYLLLRFLGVESPEEAMWT